MARKEAHGHRKKYMQEWWRNNSELRSRYNGNFIRARREAFATGLLARADSQQCRMCLVTKSAEHFYKSNTNRTGLHSWCRPCSDRRTVENGRKRIGLTPEAYQAMYAAQNGCCAICGDTEALSGKRQFCVDHNHVTGVVRGILCTRCNTTIGNARDSIVILQSAIKYLEKYQ